MTLGLKQTAIWSVAAEGNNHSPAYNNNVIISKERCIVCRKIIQKLAPSGRSLTLNFTVEWLYCDIKFTGKCFLSFNELQISVEKTMNSAQMTELLLPSAQLVTQLNDDAGDSRPVPGGGRVVVGMSRAGINDGYIHGENNFLYSLLLIS